jgi:hypothetical protein
MDAFLRAAAPAETETSVAHQIGKRGIKRDEGEKRRKGRIALYYLMHVDSK